MPEASFAALFLLGMAKPLRRPGPGVEQSRGIFERFNFLYSGLKSRKVRCTMINIAEYGLSSLFQTFSLSMRWLLPLISEAVPACKRGV